MERKKVLVIVSKQKLNVRGYHWSALGIVFFLLSSLKENKSLMVKKIENVWADMLVASSIML